MVVGKEKQEALKKRMEDLHLFEEDLVEKFVIGQGNGGQHLQKTASCVYLKHIPTGIELKCQKTRSLETNRFFARRILCEKLEEKLFGKASQKSLEIEKIRKQKQKRKQRQKKKNEKVSSEI